MMLNLIALTLLLAVGATAHECESGGACTEGPDYSSVTCGSVVKLRHIPTNFRLHSHEVSYGNSGSGQQSVTSVSATDDRNSLWMVQGTQAHPCGAGDVLKSGDKIRLRHVTTHKNLHSHLHKSPLSGNQEVSAYDEAGPEGDTGDDWKVEVKLGGVWKRGATVSFVHVDTDMYLETNRQHRFGQPIPGQLEVYCTKSKSVNANWATEEGMYIAPADDEDTH